MASSSSWRSSLASFTSPHTFRASARGSGESSDDLQRRLPEPVSDADAGGDSAEASAGAPRGTIFMSDPSAEAERVAQVLRGSGYQVVDVPLSLLLARVAVQKPRVVVVDADAEGAHEAVLMLHAAALEASIDVVFLGGEAPTTEDPESKRFFTRPVDPAEVLRRVEELTGGAVSEPASRSVPPASIGPGPVGRLPPLSLRDPHSSSNPPSGPSAAHSSGAPPVSARPSVQELPAASLRSGRVSIQTALSDELELLLIDAEQRVGAQVTHDALPTPEEELEAVLPAELLAALDEPLEEDDDEFGPDAQSRASLAMDRPNLASSQTNAGRALTPLPSEGPSARTSVAVHPNSVGRSPSVRPSPPTIVGDPLPSDVSTNAYPAASPRVAPTVAAPSMLRRGDRPLPAVPLAPSLPREEPREDPRPVVRAVSAPSVLGPADAPRALAKAISARESGALCFESQDGLRRVVLREGDLVTAASSLEDETLLAFMTTRGDLRREQVKELLGKLPPFGRHAGAALVAHGLLRQDQLWPVLRAHAEWIVGRAILVERGTARLELEPPGRLRQEPSVFGGSTGAEVLVEVTRRTVAPEDALQRMGGPLTRIGDGEQAPLLSECALEPTERALVEQARGVTVDELTQGAGTADFATVLYVLSLLGVIAVTPGEPAKAPAEGDLARESDVIALDLSAVRERVRARRDLVSEADYFTLLGISRDATGYEIRRAFLELRRSFEPSSLLTPEIADLADDVRTIVIVLDEAYEILRDTARRERYRRALGDAPP